MTTRSKKNPSSRKFDSDLAEEYYEQILNGGTGDESLSNENTGEWAELYRDERVIVYGDSMGFVYAWEYKSKSDLEHDWKEWEANFPTYDEEENPRRKRTAADKAAEQFFYKNAGYSYDPKTETEEQGRRRGAKELAKAEAWASAQGYTFEWMPEEEAWEDFLGDVPMEDVSEVQYVLMRDPAGTVVQSLGGVLFGFDSQQNRISRRVFEAELALEQYVTVHGKRNNPKRSLLSRLRNPAGSKRQNPELAAMPNWVERFAAPLRNRLR